MGLMALPRRDQASPRDSKLVHSYSTIYSLLSPAPACIFPAMVAHEKGYALHILPHIANHLSPDKTFIQDNASPHTCPDAELVVAQLGLKAQGVAGQKP